MNTNLFDGGDQLPDDTNVDFLAELTGPGKKFDRTKYQSDTELLQALAKGKYESDRYIPLLERGRDELRDDYMRERETNLSRAKLEEIVDRLTRAEQLSSKQPDANDDRKPAYDPNELSTLIAKHIQENESAKRSRDNADLVRNKLIEKYGENYRTVLRQQISSLDISEEDFNSMASRQPKVLIKTLGLDAPPVAEPFQSPVRSSSRTDSFVPRTQDRTWTWYQTLKKTSPETYHSKETSLQMYNDALALGERFKDGDFSKYED